MGPLTDRGGKILKYPIPQPSFSASLQNERSCVATTATTMRIITDNAKL